jgi:hypothetical protein
MRRQGLAVASSLPWIGGPAPCYPASSQLARHRERRSYGATSAHRLDITMTTTLPARCGQPGRVRPGTMAGGRAVTAEDCMAFFVNGGPIEVPPPNLVLLLRRSVRCVQPLLASASGAGRTHGDGRPAPRRPIAARRPARPQRRGGQQGHLARPARREVELGLPGLLRRPYRRSHTGGTGPTPRLDLSPRCLELTQGCR